MSSFVTVLGSDKGDAADLLSRKLAADWWTSNKGVTKGAFIWLYVTKPGAKEVPRAEAGFHAIYQASGPALSSRDLVRNNPTINLDPSDPKHWVHIAVGSVDGDSPIRYLNQPVTRADLLADPVLKTWQFTTTKGASASGTSISPAQEDALKALAKAKNPTGAALLQTLFDRIPK